MATQAEALPNKFDSTVVSEKRPNARKRNRFWEKAALITAAVLIPVIILAACLGALLPKKHSSSGGSSGSSNDSGSGGGGGSGSSSNNNNKDALVHLDYASYQGTQLAAGVNQYLGVRFAAPPTGDLRWRAPQAPLKASGTLDATSFGPVCLGVGAGMADGQSEDCLFANIYTPSNATTSSKLPVWIYIQGGGYAGDSNANYNGTQVVQTGNVILINFNYRVGSWGFLASEKVRSDGDLNAGLLDQRAAFNWTRNYIEQFGGDPDHIVLHGASAGAGSVGHHLVAYGGRNDNLFVGAIMQSPYFQAEMTVAELEWQFDLYTANTGCNNTNDLMTCLRNTSVYKLQAADYTSVFPGHKIKPRRSWGPTVDGDFIRDLPITLFNNGKSIPVPLLIGDEPNEGTLFAPDIDNSTALQQFFNENYPRLNSTQLSAITAQYPPGAPVPNHKSYFGPAARAYGESTLICPGFWMASAAAPSAPVWTYSFNISASEDWDNGLGAYHTVDTGAIFGPEYNGLPTDPAVVAYENVNKAVVPLMMGYYLSFVKTLDPNTASLPGAPVWDGFGTAGGRRMSFQSSGTQMQDVPAGLAANCQFWEEMRVTMEI